MRSGNLNQHAPVPLSKCRAIGLASDRTLRSILELQIMRATRARVARPNNAARREEIEWIGAFDHQVSRTTPLEFVLAFGGGCEVIDPSIGHHKVFSREEG